jgi:hypothetical protein
VYLKACAVKLPPCRVILHCVQFVLLLCLLVAEVIIQQHQLLLKSNFGSSNGTLPVASQHKASYQRLPGSAAEAGDKEKQQQSGRQKEKFSAWWVCYQRGGKPQQVDMQFYYTGARTRSTPSYSSLRDHCLLRHTPEGCVLILMPCDVVKASTTENA